VATLTGSVMTSDKSKEFVKLASRVRGVQQVVNRIETLPASMMDDDLRMGIAAGIYNSPVFSSYANQRIGPVHIIVRRGQVTLTGVVASEVERRMAEMIARSAFGAKGVDNRLRLEK
jgi:osmotically-inducible protein OsmY